MEGKHVPCVGAVVYDDRGRLLLVRRGNPPGRGLWSIPGGRVEPGEVQEETGLVVLPSRLAGRVERAGPGGVVYVIADYVAELADGSDPGAARAGDDADDVGWFTAQDVDALPCVDGLLDALRSWDLL